MNLGVTSCFKIGFMISILKNREFYFSYKYFNNQNLSHDSRNSGKFFWDIIFRKSFFKLGQTSKKNDKDYQNWQLLTNEIRIESK